MGDCARRHAAAITVQRRARVRVLAHHPPYAPRGIGHPADLFLGTYEPKWKGDMKPAVAFTHGKGIPAAIWGSPFIW